MNYFAYASNLNREQMAGRCPEAKPRFTSTLPNYRLVFSGYSRTREGATATIVGSKGSVVKGAIYDVPESGMLKLDKYEDVPNVYRRLNVIVWNERGERIEAVTYIKVKQEDEEKPSPKYLAVIRQGYRDWQIG
jgi:gamma-glutamylcyclotransferase (GGCT)/AIG2-like uncharacterized protein YtfP